MAIAVLVGKLLLAYLLGSLSGSLLLGLWRGIDIRRQGSGNAGGTNAFRTQGWRFALATVMVDAGKGALGAAVGLLLPPPIAGVSPLAQAMACGIACAIGHIYPVFFGFRGGKGAAVFVGALAVCFPLCLPILFGVWLLSLLSTGYVGLSTMLAGIALPLTVYGLAGATSRATLMPYAIAIAVLIVFTHRSNILRLIQGNEHRFERARVFARWFGSRSH